MPPVSGSQLRLRNRHGRKCRGLERTLDLFLLEEFHAVALPNVGIVLEGHSAFLASLDFRHFVLKPFQSLQFSDMDHNIVAQQSNSR